MCPVCLSSLSLPFPLPSLVSHDFPAIPLITLSPWKGPCKQTESHLLLAGQLSLVLSFSGLWRRDRGAAQAARRAWHIPGLSWKAPHRRGMQGGLLRVSTSGPRTCLFYGSHSKAFLCPLWAGFVSDLTYFEVLFFLTKQELFYLQTVSVLTSQAGCSAGISRCNCIDLGKVAHIFARGERLLFPPT